METEEAVLLIGLIDIIVGGIDDKWYLRIIGYICILAVIIKKLFIKA